MVAKTAHSETNLALLQNDEEWAKIPGILDGIEAEIAEIQVKTDLLTPQELKFVEYHLRMGMPIKKAMRKAGYRNMKPGKLYYVAIRIVEKYERRSEDHRKIMRLLGAGEVFVVQNQKTLAKQAKSEVARQAANATLGKWLGMGGELNQASQGVNIFIAAQDSAAVQVNVVPQQAQEQARGNHPPDPGPGKTITILK